MGESGIPLLLKNGTPGGSRTPNLLIRSQALYPIELRVQNQRLIKYLSEWDEQAN